MNNEKFKNDCQGCMTNIPFKNNSFDAIISIASFHHLSSIYERVKCTRNEENIKPNGTILLSVWSINQPDKTRRKFNNYGDINVNWNTNKKDKNGNFIII